MLAKEAPKLAPQLAEAAGGSAASGAAGNAAASAAGAGGGATGGNSFLSSLFDIGGDVFTNLIAPKQQAKKAEAEFFASNDEGEEASPAVKPAEWFGAAPAGETSQGISHSPTPPPVEWFGATPSNPDVSPQASGETPTPGDPSSYTVKNSPPESQTSAAVSKATGTQQPPLTTENIAKEAEATGGLQPSTSGSGGDYIPPPPPITGGEGNSGDDGGPRGDFSNPGRDERETGDGGQKAWDKMTGQSMRDTAFGMGAGMTFSAIPGDENVSKSPGKPFADDASREVGSEAMGYGKRVTKDLMTGNIPDLAKAIAEMPAAIADWSEQLVESKRHLMQFNGDMAATFMEARRRDILRNIESGQRTASSTGDLMEALSDLRDVVQPIKDVISNGLTKTLTPIVQGMATVVDYFTKWSPVFVLAEKWFGQEVDANKNMPFVQFLADVANGKNQGAKIKPVRKAAP